MAGESGNNSKRVFLCHSWVDKAAVRAVYDRLREDGADPWLDDEDLLVGQDLHTEIQKAIEASVVGVIFLSKASLAKAGYVNREIGFALDVAEEQPEGAVFVISARLEECDLPLRLRRKLAVNLFEPGGHGKLVKSLRAKGLVGGLPAKAVPVARSLNLSPRVNPKDGLTYVWIPPGRFRMGCSEGDSACLDAEKPAHEVEITRGFWMSRTPVTQGAYERVTGKTPSYFKGSELPVERVSWEEAMAYCQLVGGRLPSEAEWEYAARGGSVAARYGEIDAIAWHEGNSGMTTHRVGQKAANEFGLFDMLGNVWEWTSDWYGEYSGEAAGDPLGPATGTNKVLRGGSWDIDVPSYVRASVRYTVEPGGRFSNVGFRCVWE